MQSTSEQLKSVSLKKVKREILSFKQAAHSFHSFFYQGNPGWGKDCTISNLNFQLVVFNVFASLKFFLLLLKNLNHCFALQSMSVLCSFESALIDVILFFNEFFVTGMGKKHSFSPEKK